jgi:hypothetical protein
MRALGGMLASLRLTARLQGDMSRVCWPEPATAEVERAEVVFKIDVKPPAPSSPGVLRGNGDKPGPDPLPSHSCGNEGVQQERVDGPSQATLTKPSRSRPSRAQAQPRLCSFTWVRQSSSRTGWPNASACRALTGQQAGRGQVCPLGLPFRSGPLFGSMFELFS